MTLQADVKNRPYLDNYLRFLALFRGTITETSNAIEVVSPRAEFNLLIPKKHLSREISQAFGGSILCLPWIENLDDDFRKADLAQQAEYVFMKKAVSDFSTSESDIDVFEASTLEDLEIFTQVQARGFAESEEELHDWLPFHRSSNIPNLTDDCCKFLIAKQNGAPVGVTLLVNTEDVCGIFAVATPKEFRNQGVSGHLLSASGQIAKDLGYNEVVLQVHAGTYAQGFYTRLGFEEMFRIPVWGK